MSSWPLPKDPDEELDYQFDWSARLEIGETISVSNFTTNDGAVITISRFSISGGLTTFWATGGVSGSVVQITNRITTSAGRVYDKTATLRIQNR